jgi:hypothetical protein
LKGRGCTREHEVTKPFPGWWGVVPCPSRPSCKGAAIKSSSTSMWTNRKSARTTWSRLGLISRNVAVGAERAVRSAGLTGIVNGLARYNNHYRSPSHTERESCRGTQPSSSVLIGDLNRVCEAANSNNHQHQVVPRGYELTIQ